LSSGKGFDNFAEKNIKTNFIVMPKSGPSREELENYFKNSRPYFDELAKHYYEADREYYDKYIAPFYSSFSAFTSGSKTGKRTTASLAIAALLVALAAGFAVFLIADRPDDVNYEQIKKTEEQGSDKYNREKPSDTVFTKEGRQSDYEKGLQFFNQEDYDGAERCFRRVRKDDSNYNNAQEKLREIREIKNKRFEHGDADNERDRYEKPKPVERIR
jgi:hypothetical protein